MPDLVGPVLNPSSTHALDMAGQAVNHADPRRFDGYMTLVLAYELAALRRAIGATTYQIAQGVGCLNYLATRPGGQVSMFPQ